MVHFLKNVNFDVFFYKKSLQKDIKKLKFGNFWGSQNAIVKIVYLWVYMPKMMFSVRKLNILVIKLGFWSFL